MTLRSGLTLFAIFFSLVASGSRGVAPTPSKGASSSSRQSKFEWGAGMLSIKGAHYRGSDQSREWFIPIPYFSYSSERVEAESSFIRGTFFENDWFAFKLSILVGLNVESEKNRARSGMPNLDYTFEAGPMVIFKLWNSQKSGQSLTLEAPFRQVHVTDLSYVDRVGFFGVPFINYKLLPREDFYKWGFEASLAYMWGSKKYHQYFYGVDQQFATATRPRYVANSGYSGTQLTLILNKRWKDLILVPFYRFDWLGGVSFANSPLFRKNSYQVGGLAFFWVFGGNSKP